MDILLINQFYPPDPAPTGELLSHLGCALAKRGHRVQVICSASRYARADDGSLHASVAGCSGGDGTSGVTVRRVAGFSFGRGSTLGRVLDYASFYGLALFHALVAPRPDVVVALTTPPYIGFIGTILRLVRGCRVIQWVMDLYPDVMAANGMLDGNGRFLGLLRAMTSVLLRSADVVWTLGPYAKSKVGVYLQPEQRDRLLAAPPWAEPSLSPWESEDNAFRAELECDGRFVVMYSGNMGLGHDFETFLIGAQYLSKTLFLFVGDGPRAGEIHRAANQYGLSNLVFRSYAPKERLRESLSTGDVHILSQLTAWQGCIVPSKLAGIFAVGRPAIFVGGEQNEIAHWIREANAGFVVPVGDSEGLALAIEKLRGDPRLRERMGQNGRQFYLKFLAQDISLPKLCASVEKLGPPCRPHPHWRQGLPPKAGRSGVRM